MVDTTDLKSVDHYDRASSSLAEGTNNNKLTIKTNNMENKELNLCEILKGHEGETFYSPIYGNIVLTKVDDRYPYPLYFDTNVNNKSVQTFNSDGKPDVFCAECLLFPSKDQRDWNKWVEEQKPKAPKIWSDYIIVNRDNFDKGICDYCIDVSGTSNNGWTRRNTPIEKSALALLKIHQLIEIGYGGNITDKEWNRYCYPKYFIEYINENKMFKVMEFSYYKSHIAFHTKEQAEEFLKYSDNIQLLKDYFMI